MNLTAELRKQAKAKRDRAIKAVQAQYNRDLLEITKLTNKLFQRTRKRPYSTRAQRVSGQTPFSELCVSEAVATVLRDSTMTLMELTLEVQRRGCRQADDPRKVSHAIRATLLYRRDQYQRDKAGRWSAIS